MFGLDTSQGVDSPQEGPPPLVSKDADADAGRPVCRPSSRKVPRSPASSSERESEREGGGGASERERERGREREGAGVGQLLTTKRLEPFDTRRERVVDLSRGPRPSGEETP